MKNRDIQLKAQSTSLRKYGTIYHITSPEVRAKALKTNLEIYGTPYPGGDPRCLQSREKTNIERYGFPCCLSNPEIRKKGYERMFLNGRQAVLASNQQIHINNLFNGILNYLFGYYHIDSYVEQDNIGIEYSGGGHNLSVKTGRLTQEQFNAKETSRKNFFKNHGMHILEFYSYTDKLPSDDKLVMYYNQAKEIFANNYLYVSVNLDTDEVYYE